MKKPLLKTASLALPIIFLSAAVAEEDAVQVGTVKVMPSVKLGYAYDDNIAAAKNAVSDQVFTIEPSISLSTQYGSGSYFASLRVKDDRYQDLGAYDNTDWDVALGAKLNPTKRAAFDIGAGFKATQELPSSINNNAGQTGDKHEDSSLNAKFTYGAEGAKGRFDVYGGYESIEYTNNRGTGSETEYKDRDVNSLGGTFFYQVAPKTSALVNLEYKTFDYDQTKAGSNNLDNDSIAYKVGLTWDATAKTSGTVKIGRLEKDYDDAGVNDPSGTSYDVSVTWEPKSYSQIVLSAGKGYDEGSTTENFIETENYAVAWNHTWSSRIKTSLNYGLTDKTFNADAGTANDGRTDDLTNYGASISYRLNRWATAGINYKFSETDSNDSSADYDRNFYGISLSAKL